MKLLRNNKTGDLRALEEPLTVNWYEWKQVRISPDGMSVEVVEPQHADHDGRPIQDLSKIRLFGMNIDQISAIKRYYLQHHTKLPERSE